MVKVCECKFEVPDSQHPDYSLTEVDLFPAVGDTGEAYSIRGNLDEDTYEIFNYEHPNAYSSDSVAFSSDQLERTVERANRMEEQAVGHGSFEYRHGGINCNVDIDEILEGEGGY